MAAELSPLSLAFELLLRGWHRLAGGPSVEVELRELAALARRRRSVYRVAAAVELEALRRPPRDLEA